ncbi:Integral membrane efflux protein [Alloactinosynnema sp. L-07]|uniref:MFS transporter n=1 Tax=Alloactinosynnema sp. L-07 TaxID=1653480 RepID=UPI00065EFCA1|nr:MFS transporter [Alloactinosynnema sp. L-07]CRK57352.1 Integral membrane efflux protein [Alloactinosynnema sp. L-07]
MARHPAVRALRTRAFRRYVAGQLPSVTCSWAQVVALAWVVVDLDPRALGWMVACQFLPSVLFGPWCGAVVDRHDRRHLLILAEAGLGLVALCFAVASATHSLTLPLIYLLATVWGVVNALDTPARRALVPMLVPPDLAAGASALAGTVMLLGMTAGTAVGAVMITTVGVGATFAVNALSFLFDIALLLTIRTAASPRVKRAPGQIRDGLRYVWRTPPLRAAMLALGVVATFAFTIQVSVPILIRVELGGGAGLVGTAFTAMTAGSLVGALSAAVHGNPGPRTLARSIQLMALCSAITAASPGIPVALLGIAGIGLAWSLFLASAIATLQTAAPSMTGRVMALFSAVLLGGTALGGPVAATLADLVDPRAPFVLGAAACLVALTRLNDGSTDRTRRARGRDKGHRTDLLHH